MMEMQFADFVTCGFNNIIRIVTAVRKGDFADVRIVGKAFIGKEIMLEAFEYSFR